MPENKHSSHFTHPNGYEAKSHASQLNAFIERKQDTLKKEQKTKEEQEQLQAKREKEKKQQEQEIIKKKREAGNIRKDCTICKKEYFPLRVCQGHDEKDQDEEDWKQENDLSDSKENSPTRILDKLFELAGLFKNKIMQSSDANQRSQKNYQEYGLYFNPEILSDLLAKKVLAITNNNDAGILTYKLQYPYSTLSEEQKNEMHLFLNSILKEFNTFSTHRKISADCVKVKYDTQGHISSLDIKLPNYVTYHAFIKQFEANKLVPTSVIEPKDNKSPGYQEKINYFSPLKTKPSFANRYVNSEDKEKKREEELEYAAKKSSSIRPSSLSKRLKPVGFK